MKLSMPESKAAIKATMILRSLLDEGGPQPLTRAWLPNERLQRASAVEALIHKLQESISIHCRDCTFRCVSTKHNCEIALNKNELYTFLDGLDVAHIMLTSGNHDPRNRDRYETLKQVRAVLFKCR